MLSVEAFGLTKKHNIRKLVIIVNNLNNLPNKDLTV